MAATAISKNRYLHNGLTNFDEIWHVDASRCSGLGEPIISFIIFIILDPSGAAVILKKRKKIAISQNLLTNFDEIYYADSYWPSRHYRAK